MRYDVPHDRASFTCINNIVLLNYWAAGSNPSTPVGTPGFKPRIRPPYPQRVVKGD